MTGSMKSANATREIAQLFGSLHGVKTYLRTLFEKLGATHRAHAVALARRYRIID